MPVIKCLKLAQFTFVSGGFGGFFFGPVAVEALHPYMFSWFVKGLYIYGSDDAVIF